MASKNRPALLAKTLASIRSQSPSFEYEIIVVDDGSVGTETKQVCAEYGVNYFRTERYEYTNPGPARNIGYRAARGYILVCQSDDTYHVTEDALERLATCGEKEMLIATVWNLNPDGTRERLFTGQALPRPFFFLGSVLRKHLYAVGGDDEEFIHPGFEDDWLGARLIEGQRLVPSWRGDIIGHHQHHDRPPQSDYDRWVVPMMQLFERKIDSARNGGSWTASGGAWEYRE